MISIIGGEHPITGNRFEYKAVGMGLNFCGGADAQEEVYVLTVILEMCHYCIQFIFDEYGIMVCELES